MIAMAVYKKMDVTHVWLRILFVITRVKWLLSQQPASLNYLAGHMGLPIHMHYIIQTAEICI